MTVRLAAVLAVILSGVGVGIVHVATFIVEALAPLPPVVASLLWLSLTMVGSSLIILGLLTFYATYLNNRTRRKGEE
jgi:hypothetical protein